MLKFYVLCSREVKKGREREDKSDTGGSKEQAPVREAAGTPNDGSVPRPDYRKEDDRL